MLFCIIGITAQSSNTLKLVFAGDIMGHDTQIESAKMMGEGEYDYSSCFRYIEPYISSADIAIGNLEVTLACPPYKGYPAFSSPSIKTSSLRICARISFIISYAFTIKTPGRQFEVALP